MNYLFQVQGLICDASSGVAAVREQSAGTPVIDYSRQQLPALNEASLTESIGLGTMAYRTRWYAPKTSSFIDNDTTVWRRRRHQILRRHADNGRQSGRDGARGRHERDRGIDWNANGSTSDLIPPPAGGQDINFSGSFTSFDAGPALGLNGKPQGDDWANVDLRHTASRRNVGGLSLGVFATDLSDADPGKGDTGKGDTGSAAAPRATRSSTPRAPLAMRRIR